MSGQGSFAEELGQLALKNFCRQPGAMYGSAEKLGIGAGVIIKDVSYPVYNEQTNRFAALIGTMLVYTHECDIDAANKRPFNKHFIGMPLIYMSEYARVCEQEKKEDEARSLVVAVAKGLVSRLYFLPPPQVNFPKLECGALVYLNAITSNHVNQIKSPDDKICALSVYGLEYTDFMLQQHLLRPKSDQLAQLGPAYRSVSIYSPR